jgi:hypothetical protein
MSVVGWKLDDDFVVCSDCFTYEEVPPDSVRLAPIEEEEEFDRPSHCRWCDRLVGGLSGDGTLYALTALEDHIRAGRVLGHWASYLVWACGEELPTEWQTAFNHLSEL